MAAAAGWSHLNDQLRLATEEGAAALLAAELAGPRRRAYLLRIHARLDKLRRARERKELEAQVIGR